MTPLANYRPRIIPGVITLISREIPGDGPILVKANQEVSPSDILGLSVTTAGYRVLNFAKNLGVSPKDGQKYLQKEMGQAVFRGEVLGLKPSILGKKTFISPTDGILESFDPVTGDLKLSYLPERQKVLSAVFGVVQKVDTNRRSVIIKTKTTEILGVLGSGKVRDGNLLILSGRGGVTDEKRIVPKLTDHIIVAGGLIYKEALRAAVAISVKGVIVGGINALDHKSIAGGTLVSRRNMATDVGLSFIATEGFGGFPIGEDIFNVLMEYNNRFVVIDGNRGRLLLPSFDKEAMVKIKTTALPERADEILLEPTIEPSVAELKVGMRVRVVASPFTSEQGKVISIDQMPSRLPSGLLAYLLTVESKSRKIKVPVANVEII